MDNNERRETLLPLTDQSQQINLIVNRPAEDGEIVIDLRRVFRTMKSRLRLYAWVMVLCLVLGMCAPLLLYQFNKKPLTVSSVVTLQYDVSDLTAPDGSELDLNQITSSYVLRTALDGMTLSEPLTLSDLRDNVQVDRILTEDSRRQQEVASRMLDDKSSAAYDRVQKISLTYINSFVVSLTNGFGEKKYELTSQELQLVLDRVLSAYNTYLVETYADVKLPDDEFSAIDINTLDILESMDLIRTAATNLYAFCNSKSQAVKQYRSWRTGRSLRDLMSELQTIRSVSVDYLYSYVYNNSIARDRTTLITNYQYRLRNLQNQLDAVNNRIATNQDILKNYKNDEIFVSMQESDTAKSTKTTTDYYNNLIIEQANNYDQVASLKTRITDLEDQLRKLEDKNSASFATEEVTTELASVLAVCKETYARINDQFEEIIQSPFLTTYVTHSVPQGKVNGLLSAANAKRMVIGGVVGLVIGFGLWGLSGLAPEFKLKKEESPRKKEATNE